MTERPHRRATLFPRMGTRRAALAAALWVTVAAARADASTFDLDARVADIEARGNIAASDCDWPPEAVPAADAKLESLSKRGDDDAIAKWAATARRGARNASSVHDDDVLAALIGAQAPPLDDSAKILLESAALYAALECIGTTRAASVMIDHAVNHRAVLRGEVTRRIRSLGERAVPALLLARASAHADTKRWALATLEGMGKRVAGDAVVTTSDARLIEVLSAFGTTRDPDALSVVLSFTGSDRKLVREAARRAVRAYADEARAKLREAYNNLAVQPASLVEPAEHLADLLFVLQDKQRLADLDALIQDGLTRQATGQSAEAVAQFDRVLARDPTLERRSEFASAYAAQGMSLVGVDAHSARSHLEEAMSLDPESPRRGQIAAALAYLRSNDLQARGLDAPNDDVNSPSAGPALAGAKTRSDQRREAKREREERARSYEATAAIVLSVLCTIILFAKRPRHRRA
jgi:hypothetical protein